MSVIWMPPQTTRPPFFTALSAIGTSAPTGAKMIAASSGSGGISSQPPAQTAPRDLANPWRASAPAAGKGGAAPALPARAWAQNGRGGPDPVEAEPLGPRPLGAVSPPCARHAVATPTDQAGT